MVLYMYMYMYISILIYQEKDHVLLFCRAHFTTCIMYVTLDTCTMFMNFLKDALYHALF